MDKTPLKPVFMSKEGRYTEIVAEDWIDDMRTIECKNCGWSTTLDDDETLPNYCGGCGLRAHYMTQAEFDKDGWYR